MGSCTASAVVTFAAQLEVACKALYEAMARTYEKEQDILRELAKENAKNEKLVRRTYYEVVSDALETGFCFEGLDLSDYTVDYRLENKSYSEAVTMALSIEDKAQQFYQIAAEESKSLLADLPKAFEKLVRQREDRKAMLSKLLPVPP